MTTTRPFEADPYQRRSAVSRGFLPLLLIALGVVFLLSNFIPDRARGGLIVLGLGVAFLIGRVTTGRYGYSVPAGILIAIGVYTGVQQVQQVQGARGPGLLFVLLGLGFLLVYVIGSRPTAVWPLFPAVILMCLGLVFFGAGLLGPIASLNWIVGYWPVVLVVLGLWLIFRDHLPLTARRPIASIGGVALLCYGLLAAGSTVASGGALARSGFAPTFGTTPFNDEVTFDQPIMSSQVFTVSNSSGHTTIRGGSGSTVHVTANRHWSISGHAPEVRLAPGSGGNLNLDSSARGGFPFEGPNWVDYTIEVPSGASVNAQASSGQLEISGVNGPLQAKTSSGNITVDGVFTTPAQVQASSGNVTVKLQPGSAVRLDVQTSSGTINPSSLSLTNGETRQNRLNGDLGAPANGAVLSIKTSSGNVSIGQ